MDRYLVALHEAAHAVAFADHAMPLIDVSIAPEGRTLGRARHYEGPDGSVESWRGYIVGCLAGMAAELRAGEPRERVELHASSDIEEASDAMEEHAGGTIDEHLERARAFVARRWPLIERVARELEAHTTLSSEELACLVEGDENELANVRAFRAATGGE